MNPMTVWRYGLVGSLAILLVAALGGCSRPHSDSASGGSAAGAPAPVRVAAANRVEVESFEEVVGTVAPQTRATIEAKVSGRVVEMPVVPGSLVAAGDLLARVEAQEIDAQHRRAIALRDQAQRDVNRYAEMTDQRAVSKQELDSARARLEVATAEGAAAATMLEYTRVTAPFAGVITRKLADVGDLLTPGKPLLAMEDPTRLRFEADLPEALIDHVALGQSYRARIDSLALTVAVAASEIAPSADPGTRTFAVKFDLPPTAGLRAGQFGRVAVPVGRAPMLRLPATAVVRRGQLELAFAVADGVARLRIVKTGKRDADQVEIVAGLEPGEMVVVKGGDDLVDGRRVEVEK